MSIFLLIYLLIWNLNGVKCAGEDTRTVTGQPSCGEDQTKTQITLVELDIKTKNNTTEYSYSKENNEGTFVTKADCGFKKIKLGKTVIWESSDPKKYAYKVVIDGLGFLSSTKNIFIYLDGCVMHFKKSSQNDSWEEQGTTQQESTNKQTTTPRTTPPTAASTTPTTPATTTPPTTAATTSPVTTTTPTTTAVTPTPVTPTTTAATTGTTPVTQPSTTPVTTAAAPEAKPIIPPTSEVSGGAVTPPTTAAPAATTPTTAVTPAEATPEQAKVPETKSTTPATPSVTQATVTPTQAQATTPVTTTQPSSTQPKAPESTTTTPVTVGPASSLITTESESGENFLYASFYDSDVKLYSQDKSDPNKFVELDANKYELDKSNQYIHKYTFNNEGKCVKFTLKNHEIWKHGDNNCQEYPKTIYLHKGKTIVFIEFPNNSFNFYRFSVKDNNMKLETLRKLEDNFESKHKLLTLEGDGSSTKENDKAKYELKKYDFAYEYKFNSDAKCTSVKFDGKEVWKYDSSHDQNNYPLLVYFLSKYLVLFLKNDKCFFIDPDKVL
ncbi:hypothetical protein TpMuguga_02g00018 [Theileria parva strain Muguga]|uniref:SfiI-subtelomeric related protein family member n=1 Tax=Theileria parva TaxID=5875 RepID=Q4N6B9_THEPA|nr:uncharacterized protein TpMuguga_02g00018 [Theileria parva strain Muguga]EAN32304.1 hypothetical protein TpMuguga_02g00018 [Theileria parva strain Muguga]|eukprot:XP_764587.1 hypothetical protein [Theileria parva strain Muguga]